MAKEGSWEGGQDFRASYPRCAPWTSVTWELVNDTGPTTDQLSQQLPDTKPPECLRNTRQGVASSLRLGLQPAFTSASLSGLRAVSSSWHGTGGCYYHQLLRSVSRIR